MSWASGEVVGILIFLLPGFVTASIFYWLTSHPATQRVRPCNSGPYIYSNWTSNDGWIEGTSHEHQHHSPDEGHFRIAEGEWLVEDERIPAKGVSAILIPAGEVEMVEFLNNKPNEEPKE